MAATYKSPLEAYKQRKQQRPGDIAEVKPPQPKKREGYPGTFREFLKRVHEQDGYPLKLMEVGDIYESTCPYHGKVEKVWIGVAGAICVLCYPEHDPRNQQQTEQKG